MLSTWNGRAAFGEQVGILISRIASRAGLIAFISMFLTAIQHKKQYNNIFKTPFQIINKCDRV
ncbi:hypothetical protein VIBNIAM115_1260006 [Vibrio nigripulchritudo AM115]|nr:hypothetical protein VIBNIAM115_1260006 [Vibrio nigripulchritudo AM115]